MARIVAANAWLVEAFTADVCATEVFTAGCWSAAPLLPIGLLVKGRRCRFWAAAVRLLIAGRQRCGC